MLTSQGRFPKPIPPADDVPSWAYLNVTLVRISCSVTILLLFIAGIHQSDVFDPVAAQAS
jgi:hypothetical protein